MKISNKIKGVAGGVAGVIAMGVRGAVPAFAASTGKVMCPDGKEVTGTDLSACSSHGVTASGNDRDALKTVNTVINVIIGLIGFVAVVVIILGGFQYTTSAGDPSKVTKAKNTIMYGVIGLVISLLAFAIVNFVLANVFNAS